MLNQLLTALWSGSWLTEKRVELYPLIFLTISALGSLAYVLTGQGNIGPIGKPIGTDFASFWTASKFILAGNPVGAYDPTQHHAAQTALFGKEQAEYYAWFYPPTALLLVVPLGLLPYLASLFTWLAVTGAAYASVVRRLIPRPEAIVPILGFPAVIVNVIHGQNAFLSTAIIGGGLLMSERRPVLAGAVLGCMCYKPQLGLMLAVVVLASRNWKMALGAAVSITVQVAAAVLLFGIDIWTHYFKLILPLATIVLEDGLVEFGKMQSVFAAARLIGGGVAIAYSVQAVAAIAASVMLWQIWRSETSLPLRTGATGAAILLGTPFVLDYDLMLLALPIAALTAEGLRTGFNPYEKSALAAAWLLPAAARLSGLYISAPLSPEAALFLLVLVWKRVHEPITPTEPPPDDPPVIEMPVLFPALIELVAVNVPPPENVKSRILT